jgi:hypothetical protein
VTPTRHLTALIVAACVAVATPSHAAGQVTVLSDLSFGTILSGTTTSVAPTSASAANWKIHGSIGVAGVITVSLPSSLTKSGGTTMPVSFCSTCGVYRINNSNPSGGTAFNPNNALILTVVVLSDIYIWVGGSVNPPLAQSPGSYSGTMVITVIPLL